MQNFRHSHLWDCNATIAVTGPSAGSADIQAAMDQWNTALASDAVRGIPRFVWANGTPDLVIQGDSSGVVCGHTFAIDTPIVMNINSPTTCTHPDIYGRILIHEFAHVLGFNGTTAHTVGVPGVSENCVINLPRPDTTGGNPAGSTSPGVNTTVCQHEIEFIYQVYGQRQGGFDQTAFWDHPIVTGLRTTPASVTVDKGSSVQVTVNQLSFTRGQLSTAPLDSTTFSWEPSNPALAAVDANGLVTGKGAGTGNVVITPNNIPSIYLQGTTLVADHFLVPLTVVDTASAPPGCGPTLRVTAITVDQEPAITTAGSHGFAATTVGCGGPVTYDWTFDPSAPGMTTTRLLDAAAAVSYPVAAGSYTLTVTALPYDGSQGIPLVRSVNVCTGGGLELLQAPGSGSDPGTNAVGGCGGPGGEPLQ